MGVTQTINLSRIPQDPYYEQVLQRRFVYDENIATRLRVKRNYFRQRRIAEKQFTERSMKLNNYIIEAVQSFVSRSLNLDGTRYFSCSDKIYGATLVLDMQISDHELTFSMIEKHLRRQKTNLCVIRIKSNLLRKKSIPELLDAAKQSKRVFIIIEQSEVLSRVLTEAIVGQLKNRLSDDTSPTDIIMILFCLSVRVQTLPFDQMNCFGRMEDIMKDQSLVKARVMDDLLRSEGLAFKLGPSTLDLIYYFHLYVDSSITSVLYLYTYALFEHYLRLEQKPDVIEHDLELFEVEHQRLCDHLDRFFKLLHDDGLWPDDKSDMYGLFPEYNNLAESEDFQDSLRRLMALQHDILLRSIQRVLNEFETNGHSKGRNSDVITILKTHKERILNNKDSKKHVADLVNELTNLGQTVGPVVQKYESFYFEDRESIQEQCLTSMRGCAQTIQYLSDKTTYFGILFSRLIQSTAQVSASDLCDDVMEDFIKLIQSELPALERPNKTKPAPKRARRRTTVIESKENKLTRQDEEGLARAIFVDVIDCMEHQLIIKIDPKSKSKMIKRLAWPT